MLPPDWQAMGEAAKLFTRSLMMGLDSAVRKAEFDEPSAEDIENMPYHEAVEYLKKRDVIKKVDYDSLSDKMRFRAFTASRIADGDLLKKLNAEMIASVNDGKGLSDFLSLTKTDILDKIGMGAGSGWYYETVYRTNVQTAYNVGRAMGFAEDKPLALELVIIDDSRTSDICRQYAGKRFILPYDHPFWQTHWPPFHFNCRTTIRAIYDESELPENWSNPKDIEDANNGFGAYPLAGDGWWNELASQVARAKKYGVQGEIEAAKEILISKESDASTGGILAKPNKTKNPFAFSEIEGSHTRKQDLKATNPNYEGKHKAPYSINCQRCVSAYEARRRGFNVTAKPRIYGDKTDRLPYMKDPNGWTSVYINPKLKFCGNNSSGLKTRETVRAYMKKWGNGARAIVRIEWQEKYGGGGHVFVAEQIKGKTFFFDPQCNKTNVADYFERAKKTETYLLRVDNLDFSDKIKLCCEDVK